jgi:hypothetical protein
LGRGCNDGRLQRRRRGYTGQRTPEQQKVLQRNSSVTGPGPWQVAGATHWAPPVPQLHWSLMHCSPWLQQIELGPQTGPLGQPPEGPQAEGSGCTASPQAAQASTHGLDVHETLPSLQVQETIDGAMGGTSVAALWLFFVR